MAGITRKNRKSRSGFEEIWKSKPKENSTRFIGWIYCKFPNKTLLAYQDYSCGSIILTTNFQLSSNRPKTSDEIVTVATLFTSPQLRTMMLLMVVSYISIAIVFDGLVRMSENMGLDFFVTFTLAAATEIPSLALLALVLDRYLLNSIETQKIFLKAVVRTSYDYT